MMTRPPGRGATALIALALVARMASSPTGAVSFLMLAGYALLGPAQAIEALALGCLFSQLNPGLAPEVAGGSSLRYLILICAVLSVFVRQALLTPGLRISRVVLATALLSVLLVAHSVLLSPMADVSVLKAVSWGLTTCTLLAGWRALSPTVRGIEARRLYTALLAVLVASLPLLPFSVGVLRNGSGFQGVLNHPQALGPLIALLGAWTSSSLLAVPRPRAIALLLIGACLIVIVRSEARTAGFALVLGLAVTIAVRSWLSGRPARAVFPALSSPRIRLLGAFFPIAAIIGGQPVANELGKYVAKRGNAGSGVVQAYEASRGDKMQEMWGNIQARPLVGLGFGIASDPDSMEVQHDSVSGLALSAPVEKGVLPLAVLEELGVGGAVLVGWWLWMLLRRAARAGAAPLAVAVTVLLINMGEYVLFSPGGMGMLYIVLLTWAATAQPGELEIPAKVATRAPAPSSAMSVSVGA